MKRTLLVAALFSIIFAGQALSADTEIWGDLDNIYYGDLHVHTSASLDAWAGGFPKTWYPYEAGMYATYCSRLDFYCVTDHAEYLTDSGSWKDSIENAQRFNELGRAMPDQDGDRRGQVFS